MDAIELARRTLYAQVPQQQQPMSDPEDATVSPQSRPCIVSSVIVQRLVAAICVLIIITITNALINLSTVLQSSEVWHNDSGKVNVTLLLIRHILSQLNAPPKT